MQLVCPHCQRTLEFSAERPAFCGFCGKPLAPLPLDSTLQAATLLYTPTTPVAEPRPDAINGYRLLRQLGTGGMGTVYEAEECATGRRVAVKLIAAHFAASSEAVERFRQEGRLASGIAHPRCVFVLSADEAEGRPYIVMELMPGETLRDLVERQGPLPLEDAVARILDIIDGLREAHRLGVIHRDVKPSNCFLEADGRVKVGDFGLSKSLDHDSQLTRTGAFLGTPLYASPEQIRRDKLDPQTDLYSVAATLYYLLTGQAPHETADASATMARIVADPAPSMRSLRPEVPAALDRIVLRALERQRERRYRNLDEFRAALLPFAPGKLSIGGMGIRFGAYLLDYLLIMLLVFALVYLLILCLGGEVTERLRQNLAEISSLAVWLGYFTLFEGLWGWSLGKRLLRLRVAPARGSGPPGLPRALGRNVVAYLLIHLGSIPFLIGTWFLGLPTPEAGREIDKLGCAFVVLAMLLYPLTAVGVGILISTMRARNGYRGVHEFLSGTRVVSLPEPERRRRFPSRLGQDTSHPDGLPSQVGPFVVAGALRWGSERVLLAEDPGLGRKVAVWLRSPSEPGPAPARHDLSRPTRWRWLTTGEQEGRTWDAFLAVPGCTLQDLVASSGRLTWPEARALLESLAEELNAAVADGTLPRTLDVSQVWMQSDGPPQLLDMPLNEPSCHVDEPESAQARALTLLGRAAVLALEGQRRAEADDRPVISAPLPEHAADMLARLRNGKYETVPAFQADLAATRDRPQEVTRARRAAQLALLTLFVSVGLFCTMLPSAAMPGFSMSMMNTFQTIEKKRHLYDLEVGALSQFTIAGLDPNPIVRLYAVHQLQEDVALRDELRERLDRAEQERLAYQQSVGLLTRLYLHSIEQQMEKSPARADLDPQNFRFGNHLRFRENARHEVKGNLHMEEMLPVFLISLVISLLFWPAQWVLWTLITRGGISTRIMGLSLARANGGRASRLRCAWRALLGWLPLILLLGLSGVLELWFWTHWTPENFQRQRWALWVSSGLWWSAVGLLVLYVALALWRPARSLTDRLAGTSLVPR